MAEREENTKQPEKGSESDRQSAAERLAPAEEQTGSLKVHGDKLEKLIPKERE
jgi:hypothetical protein